ncbi:MAG: dTDP-glucose 4,6-dehydratase [Deltaproteobacteria bacterium]|nr:dTDP-glucose 4,6-dehydratase [Deltaproteobacteria bacterium]MCB9487541.1 dTDP-glucose 4,6-dehydratase [Deltaproteobacteria bacterium]
MSARVLLVTGAAGFIGANYVRHVRNADPQARIVAYDLLTYAGNLENLAGLTEGDNYRFVKGDIRDAKALDAVFSDEKITHVVNFAAESHVDRSILGPEIFVDVNIRGTQILLEAARRHGVERFLQVSTDEVYGSLGPSGLFTEQTPVAPNSPYSASKAGADHLARAYYHTYNLPTLITRCSNNYGPYQFPEKLIPLMLINCLEGKPLPVYGDGMNVRDWLHVSDHASAIEVVLATGRVGEAYNIGGNNEWPNIEIVKRLAALVDERTGKAPGTSEALITYVTDRPGHDRRYAIDSTKIRDELGWTPTYTFEAGLPETVDWYLENESWWRRIISGEYRDYYAQMYGERERL